MNGFIWLCEYGAGPASSRWLVFHMEARKLFEPSGNIFWYANLARFQRLYPGEVALERVDYIDGRPANGLQALSQAGRGHIRTSGLSYRSNDMYH